jgi:hypothetical protein
MIMAGAKRPHKDQDNRPAKKSRVTTSIPTTSQVKEENGGFDNDTGGVALPRDTFLNG